MNKHYSANFTGAGSYMPVKTPSSQTKTTSYGSNFTSSHQSAQQSIPQPPQPPKPPHLPPQPQRKQQQPQIQPHPEQEKLTKLFDGRGTYYSKPPIYQPGMNEGKPEHMNHTSRRPYVNVTPINNNKGPISVRPPPKSQQTMRPVSKSTPPNSNTLSISQTHQTTTVSSNSHQTTIRRTPFPAESKDGFKSRTPVSSSMKYSSSEPNPESIDSRGPYDQAYPESYDSRGPYDEHYDESYDSRSPYDPYYPEGHERGTPYDQYTESYDSRGAYDQHYPESYDGQVSYSKQKYPYEPMSNNINTEYIDLTKSNADPYHSRQPYGNKYTKSTPKMSYRQDFNYMPEQSAPTPQQDFYYQDQNYQDRGYTPQFQPEQNYQDHGYSPQFQQEQNYVPQTNNYIQQPRQSEDYLTYQQPQADLCQQQVPQQLPQQQQAQCIQQMPQQQMQYVQPMPQQQMQYVQQMPQQQMQYPQQYISPQYYQQMQGYIMNQQPVSMPQLPYVVDNDCDDTSTNNCNKCHKQKSNSDNRCIEYGPCGEEIEIIKRDTVYVSRDDPCAEQFIQVPDQTPQYQMPYQPVNPSMQPVTQLQEMPQEQLQVVQLNQQAQYHQPGNIIVCEPCEMGLEDQCLTGQCNKPFRSMTPGPQYRPQHQQKRVNFFPVHRRALRGNRPKNDGPPAPTILPTIYKSLHQDGDYSDELPTFHDRYGKSQRSDYQDMSQELWADYFHDLKMQNLRENEYDYGFSEDFVNNKCERNDRGCRRGFNKNRQCLDVPGTEYIRNDYKVRIESRNNILQEAEELSMKYRVSDAKTQNWPADYDYDA